ncbi:hypothetical protein ILYODFUR_018729 [Ilyodon furcidens]|uniref:Uncharacterized protein n=1 Tax=Ilyodon furcidens TaxID=33524 RepID=A0ABV0U6J9_9TELE
MHGHSHSLCLHARHRRSTYSVGGRTEAHTISAASQWGDAAKSRQSGHSTGAFRRTRERERATTSEEGKLGPPFISAEEFRETLKERRRERGAAPMWLIEPWIAHTFSL